MSTTRRDFLKTSLAASATGAALAAGLTAASAAQPVSAHEYYELRAYRLKPGTSTALLDGYLAKALIPALNARGLTGIGVFTEIDVDKKAVTSKPKVGTPEAPVAVWVLITHPTLESFASVAADLNLDPAVQSAGAEYLKTPKASPAFDRIDTWLMRAFAGFPRRVLPSFSKNPSRVFELRDYDSHSEERALNKMAMFNDGEIAVMKDLGMSPVFYGQTIAGPNMPHLRYITGAADLATHLDNWKKFGTHPGWVKLKDDPQYKDNTSRTGPSRFVVPTAYSQI